MDTKRKKLSGVVLFNIVPQEAIETVQSQSPAPNDRPLGSITRTNLGGGGKTERKMVVETLKSDD